MQEIDPDLTLFALAEALDLHRDEDGGPNRVLEWYRDGMERRIVLRPAAATPDGGLDVEVVAVVTIEGDRHWTRRPLREGIAPGELRTVLPKALEAANALTRQ